MIRILPLFIVFALLAGCSPSPQQSEQEQPSAGDPNPAATGFRTAESDPKAIAIADETMEAMGGRKAWDETAIIQWTFFGRRHLLWDKSNQMARIEEPQKQMVAVVNLVDGQGRVWEKGKEMTDADSLTKYLGRAKSIWINDSYWLVMPYKLKDSGVALNYLREDSTQDGRQADVLRLTFEGVGDTPQNAYEVFVDKEKKLVTQWAFFREATQTDPAFITPWADYNTYGNILLSGDRQMNKLDNIKVMEKAPKGAFDKGEVMLPL